jgi:hypothetical protein
LLVKIAKIHDERRASSSLYCLRTKMLQSDSNYNLDLSERGQVRDSPFKRGPRLSADVKINIESYQESILSNSNYARKFEDNFKSPKM